MASSTSSAPGLSLSDPSSFTFLLVALVVLISTYLVFVKKTKKQNGGLVACLPPGPKPAWIIGNVHQFERDKICQAIATWSRSYGPFVTVRFASRINVVANTIDSCREIVVKNGIACAGREDNFIFRLYSPNLAGVALSDYGEEWKFCRRITHSCLKTYGSQREKVERLVIDECLHLVASLEVDKNISVRRKIELTVTNVIAAMLLGSRYEEDDPEFLSLAQGSSWFTDAIGVLGLTFLSPWLRYMYYGKIKQFKQYVKTRDNLLDKKLREHRLTYKEGVTRDFLDAIIQQSNEMAGDTRIPVDRLNEHLRMIMADILFAGVDTTFNSLLWGILFLIRWPEKQEKLFSELRNNLESIKDLRYENKASFPYLEATIHEILRRGSISSLGITHKAMQDVILSDYHIPKGTVLLTNIFAIHHDENFWKNPQEFSPERFINEQGSFEIPNRSFMPFSEGPRSCVGKNLSKMKHFYFIAYLVYHFRLEAPTGKPLPTLDGLQKAVRETTPYELVLRNRDP